MGSTMAVTAINESIASGWAGIFPPKVNQMDLPAKYRGKGVTSDGHGGWNWHGKHFQDDMDLETTWITENVYQ